VSGWRTYVEAQKTEDLTWVKQTWKDGQAATT
jgi:hypothetical protein